MALAANLIGVLLAGVLLGVVIWVVDVGVLAWLASRPSLNSRAVAGGLAVAAVTALTYIAVIVLVGLLLAGRR